MACDKLAFDLQHSNNQILIHQSVLSNLYECDSFSESFSLCWPFYWWFSLRNYRKRWFLPYVLVHSDEQVFLVLLSALIPESFHPNTRYSVEWSLLLWRDTFLEWELFSYREAVRSGSTHFQEIRNDVLSEGRGLLNPPVCLSSL